MQLSRSLILEVHLVPHGLAINYGTKGTLRHALCLSSFRDRAADISRRLPDNREL
jgi:hypothetical protein